MTQVVYIHTAGEKYSPGDLPPLPTETEPAADPGRQSQPSEMLALDSLSFTHVLGPLDEILVRVKCAFLIFIAQESRNLARSNRSLLMKCSIRRNTKLGVENQCRRTRRRFEEPPISSPSTTDFFTHSRVYFTYSRAAVRFGSPPT